VLLSKSNEKTFILKLTPAKLLPKFEFKP